MIKVPMQIAAANLEQICNAIDESELNDSLSKIFHEGRLDLSAAVDRRICFFDLAEERIATLKRLRDEFSQAAKRMEFALERVKEGTISIMESYEDFSYRGELGKLRLQKNPSARLEFQGTKVSTHTISNVIDALDIQKHAIDGEYFETRRYFVLLNDKIREAIESGKEIPWAKLQRGKHIRIQR